MNLDAFVYLTTTSFRNRWRVRGKRIREPRYLIGVVLGAAYLWFFLVHYPSSPDGNPAGLFLSGGGQVLATAAIFIMTLSSWILGGDRMALAFSQAEVAFLFPAPLSRQALVGYKLFRAQFAILFNTFVWVLLLRRGGTLPVVYRALGMWMLFTTLNFHRLVAALVRTSVDEHRGHGARRHWSSITVFLAAGAAIAVSLWIHRTDMSHAHGLRAVSGAIGAALASAPASIALWPFNALLGPAFATSVPEWLRAAPPALLVLLLNVWWVMRTDTAFEEAALAATAERVERVKQFRESRGWRRSRPVARAVRVPARLSSSGNPAVAIIWKNVICLRRTLRWQDLLPLFFPSIVSGIVVGQVALPDRGFSPWLSVATISFTIAVLMLLFGARIIRNDLRQDMLHIVALKTLPLRGRAIVAAEVLSAAIPVAVIQLGMLAITGVSVVAMGDAPVGVSDVVMIWCGAVPTLLAYNIASVTVQNAAPVFFPAWSRLGTNVSPGLESLGQNLVSLILILVILLVLLILPVAFGASMWYLSRALATIAIFFGLIAGAAVLSLEAYGAILAFGRAFEKTEPSQVA